MTPHIFQPPEPKTWNGSHGNENSERAYEPHRDKTNKMACAPSEFSDQPGHPGGSESSLGAA